MSAFFIAYLLQNKKINKQMFSYQVFRIILVALSKFEEGKFCSKVWCSILAENDFLPLENRSLADENLSENLFNHDDCLLIDHTGLLNVFHTLTRANYNRVRFIHHSSF